MNEIEQLIEKDDFSEYGVVRQLEEEFAAYVCAPHAVAVNSGTSAIFLALRGLGIGPGDEVIVAPNTCHSVTCGVALAGASFRFADVDALTFNLDPEKVAAAITERSKAILAVHMYGHPADLDGLLQIAETHGLVLIEDAALATGARYKGRRVGSIAPIGVFSFGPHKLASALGGAGMIVTHDGELANRIRLLRGYGVALDYPDQGEMVNGIRLRSLDHVSEAVNMKMDSIQGAVVRIKLRYADEWMAMRNHAARRYHAGLSGLPIQLPLARPEVVHAYRMYVIRVQNRDFVRRKLAEQGIETTLLYSPPLHLQTVYGHRGYARGQYPVAEELCDQLLNLPMYNGISDSDVDRVIEALHIALGACG